MTVPLSGGAQAVIKAAIKDREHLATGRSRVIAIVVLVLAFCGGLFLIFVIASGRPSDPPTCDGQQMTTSDECTVYTNHSLKGITYSYQEMIDQRESGNGVTKVIGYGVLAVTAVMVVPAMIRTSPSRPWGRAVPAACPTCGRPNLREKSATEEVMTRGGTYRYSGIVTLCTPDCEFSHVRRK